MKIYNVPFSVIEQTAESLGIRFVGSDDGPTRNYRHRAHGSLKPPQGRTNPYPRVSAGWGTQGRKVAAVCWHGYRDFMQELFYLYDDARITSNRNGYVSYDGIDEFNEKHEATGYTDIGPQISPMYMCEACVCGKQGTTS